MAHRRMLAASISISEQVASLETDFARLLFTWMIAHADDYGVLPGTPATVRALVVPMLDVATATVSAALADMERQELIWRYSVDGKPFVQFRTWEVHQSGLHKRTAPRLPRYSDLPGNSGNSAPQSTPFREVPRTSGKFPEVLGQENRTEQKRTEENKTPTGDAHRPKPDLRIVEPTTPPDSPDGEAQRASAQTPPVSESAKEAQEAPEQKPPKKKPRYTPQEHAYHRDLMARVRLVCKLSPKHPIPNEQGKEMEAAHWFFKAGPDGGPAPPADVIEFYRLAKRMPFMARRSGYMSLAEVEGFWTDLHGDVAAFAARVETERQRDATARTHAAGTARTGASPGKSTGQIHVPDPTANSYLGDDFEYRPKGTDWKPGQPLKIRTDAAG